MKIDILKIKLIKIDNENLNKLLKLILKSILIILFFIYGLKLILELNLNNSLFNMYFELNNAFFNLMNI